MFLCEFEELRLPAQGVVGTVPVACSWVLKGEERVELFAVGVCDGAWV